MSFFRKIWEWIKGLFSSDPAPVIEDKPIEVEPVKDTDPEPLPDIKEKDIPMDTTPVRKTRKPTKIALIVGHTAKNPGAKNYLGETEFSFNSRIAEKTKKFINEKWPEKQVKIFYRPDGYYLPSIKKVAEDVGAWGGQLSLELHFNSFKLKAYGCEILIVKGSPNIMATSLIADQITDNLAKKFDLKQRTYNEYGIGDGIKLLTATDRGFYNLKYVEDQGVTMAMLIEPCYANLEQKESKAIFENEDDYAELLADELSKIEL